MQTVSLITVSKTPSYETIGTLRDVSKGTLFESKIKVNKMWMEQRKVKTKVIEPIPDDLVSYLREVDREITDGEETALIESDDLLQYEQYDFAYGGLANSETEEYEFRYFTGDENDSTWDFRLSRAEIERIVKGEIRQLPLWACVHPVCGGRFTGAEDFCSNCDKVIQAKP